ncbi:MAG: tyrosine-type recombinase/integrase [Anaerohalosphaeraceae bacterium]|nr:tyrosine-type recombinase/integrase [Anaerohalosphaeraceae bacterium]
MTTFSTMMKKVEQYLAHKRSLGYKMRTDGRQLQSFARYADIHAPAGPLTVDLALRWATSPEGIYRRYQINRRYHAQRLSLVRGLARYLMAFDPRTEILPRRLVVATDTRVPPYIYTQREIAALIRECLAYRPSMKHQAYTGVRNATIIGLLACTGMRIGEVLALKNSDVDLVQNVITVRHSKNLPPIPRPATCSNTERSTTNDSAVPMIRMRLCDLFAAAMSRTYRYGLPSRGRASVSGLRTSRGVIRPCMIFAIHLPVTICFVPIGKTVISTTRSMIYPSISVTRN